MTVQENITGMITQDSLQKLMRVFEGHQNGSLGPVSWQVEYKLDKSDLPSCYAKVKLQIFGVEVADVVLDTKNPKVSVKEKVFGFDVAVEIGMDVKDYSIYYAITISGITYRNTIISFGTY